MTEENIDFDDLDADSLISQLRENNSIAKNKEELCERFELSKEDLEAFILNSTGKLIKDSLETIDTIKQYVLSAPNPEEVHSLAELYKASTSALDTLNKVLLQDKKSATQVGIKQMDIESKSQLADKKENKRMLTRDDIIKKLITDADIIEVDEDTSTQ
jgi:hypothetical protein